MKSQLSSFECDVSIRSEESSESVAMTGEELPGREFLVAQERKRQTKKLEFHSVQGAKQTRLKFDQRWIVTTGRGKMRTFPEIETSKAWQLPGSNPGDFQRRRIRGHHVKTRDEVRIPKCQTPRHVPKDRTNINISLGISNASLTRGKCVSDDVARFPVGQNTSRQLQVELTRRTVRILLVSRRR